MDEVYSLVLIHPSNHDVEFFGIGAAVN